MVLPTFVRQALLGEAITVYGSGEQSRCFTHVSDIVDGLAAVALHDATIGQIYNLGNTLEISINQLARFVLAATGSSSPIVHIPYDEAYAPGFEDMPRRLPDITKAQTAFDFRPRRDLDQILADVITDQRTRLDRRSESACAANF
jgi:UDP-glucose 4-epimerase